MKEINQQEEKKERMRTGEEFEGFLMCPFLLMMKQMEKIESFSAILTLNHVVYLVGGGACLSSLHKTGIACST
jgi:hypothetical protein